MSRKKDRARAAAGEIHREGKVVKLGKCPVPLCEGHVRTGQSAHGLCLKHEEDLAFLIFILPHIKMEQGKTPSGLVLPGQPGYNAVPEEVVLKEMKEHGRIKPRTP